MKPKNFPERKRQRQERALSRLSEPVRSPDESLADFYRRSDVIEWKALERAVYLGSRRDVRTKKSRSSIAKMFRAA